MNQFFNIQRFAKYAAYDVRTNYKRYLMAVAIGAVGAFLITYSNIRIINIMGMGLEIEEQLIRMDFQMPFAAENAANGFIFSLIIFFPIFLMLSFPALTSKKSTMNYLLLPASTFEKYLYELIVRIFIGFGLFLLIFYLMANFALIAYELFLNVRFAEIVAEHQRSISMGRLAFADVIRIIFGNNEDVQRIWVIPVWIANYLCVFSVRTFFGRFAFVKTMVVIIGVIFLYMRLPILDILYTTSQFVWFFIVPLVLMAVACLILGYYTLKRKRI